MILFKEAISLAKHRKKISKLRDLEYSIYRLLFLSLLILIASLPGLLREYNYRTASGTLHSWKYEYSPHGKNIRSKASFEVDIGGRIHRIDAVAYLPLIQGTPYYADELEQILSDHIGDTVDYTYRLDNRSTVVHMEIDGEIIVDQAIIRSRANAGNRFGLTLSGVCFGIGILLIPRYISLKRRRHARRRHK